MCALEGTGVLQDRFENAGKGRCCSSSPRLVLKLAVPQKISGAGARGGRGHSGGARRPGSNSLGSWVPMGAGGHSGLEICSPLGPSGSHPGQPQGAVGGPTGAAMGAVRSSWGPRGRPLRGSRLPPM